MGHIIIHSYCYLFCGILHIFFLLVWLLKNSSFHIANMDDMITIKLFFDALSGLFSLMDCMFGLKNLNSTNMNNLELS